MGDRALAGHGAEQRADNGFVVLMRPKSRNLQLNGAVNGSSAFPWDPPGSELGEAPDGQQHP